jgi:hypothetical protein
LGPAPINIKRFRRIEPSQKPPLIFQACADNSLICPADLLSKSVERVKLKGERLNVLPQNSSSVVQPSSVTHSPPHSITD